MPASRRNRLQHEAERNDIVGERRKARDHGAFANADVLMHGAVAAEEDVVADNAMAAKHRVVRDDHVVANMTIVSDMRSDHQETLDRRPS